MKRILCMICILTMLFMTSCTTADYNISYDDVTFYLTAPPSAEPGDMVQLFIDATTGASFYIYANDLLLSPHSIDEERIMYEFVMPYENVYIRHIQEEEPEMNDVHIPASMNSYRIEYSTDYAFSEKYAVATNPEETSAIFAGFKLYDASEIQPFPENFFDNNIIIAYLQYEGSGSVGHSLKSVTLDESNNLIVNIKREVPSIGTCDVANWLLLITVNKTMLPEFYNITITTTEEMLYE